MKNKGQCAHEDQLYGMVTVGERGQVVIPADARKKMDINPGDKLLVMGHPFAEGIVFVKLDSMRETLSRFMEGLSGVESMNVIESKNGESED